MNIYLISVESYHLIDWEVKKIVNENPAIKYNMNKASIKEVIEEANYFSLTGDQKYLIINNADFFGTDKLDEKDSELILNYLKEPNLTTTIIFTTQKQIDSRKKIVKIIKDNYELIYKPKMDKRSLTELITKYVQENEYNIDYNSVNYLINNSYNNLDIIYNELDKIFLYYNFPCTIKLQDIIKIIGEELDSNNFHFVNAVIEKNLKKSIKIYNSLRIYKVEPTSLIVLLAREYRLMYYVLKMYQNHTSLSEISNNLNLADWQIQKLYNNAIHYKEKELLKNLTELCNLDKNIKKGIWDKNTAIYNFLLEACI